VIDDRVGTVEALGRDDVLVVQALALVARGGVARKLEVVLSWQRAELEVLGHDGRG
jgi:hypothetical protein